MPSFVPCRTACAGEAKIERSVQPMANNVKGDNVFGVELALLDER